MTAFWYQVQSFGLLKPLPEGEAFFPILRVKQLFE
jgi:hypothetical protein